MLRIFLLFTLSLLAFFIFIKWDPFYWLYDRLISLGLGDLPTFTLHVTLLAALAILLGVILYRYHDRSVFGWQLPIWRLFVCWLILFGVTYLSVDWLYHR